MPHRHAYDHHGHRHHAHDHAADGHGENGGHGRRFARGERGNDDLGFGRTRHRGRGGQSGLGRFFAHGDLRLVILALIAEKPRHGYDLIKAIEEQVGGSYSPSPGVIYPTLTLLEELGYVTVSTAAEGSRKLHEITEQGRAFLVANRPAVDALLNRMAMASRDSVGEPAPQILRAMENLKLALRLKLSGGPLSAEQTAAVASALDIAATSVERV